MSLHRNGLRISTPWRMVWRGLLFMLLPCGAAVLFAWAAQAQQLIDPRPQGFRGVGHPENHAHYNALPLNRSGVHCCNDADCRPSSAQWSEGGWQVLVDGVWRDVPEHSVLDQAYLQSKGTDRWDEIAHVCVGLSGALYCFIPPESGG